MTRCFRVLAWITVALLASAASGKMPMTGTDVPELECLDTAITQFMSDWNIPGGSVAIVKDGRLVYARGYGYADTNRLKLVYPDSLFRLCSISKAITAVAVLKLIEDTDLSLDDYAFDVLSYDDPRTPDTSSYAYTAWLSYDDYVAEYSLQAASNCYPLLMEGRSNDGTNAFRSKFIPHPWEPFGRISGCNESQAQYDSNNGWALTNGFVPVDHQVFTNSASEIRHQASWIRFDPRIFQVKVRHLLNHTGGWNKSTAINPSGGVYFEPPFWQIDAAKEMGTKPPASANTIMRWMFGKPLQFDPGTEFHYSNYGYVIAARIIEKKSGQPYEQYVQSLLRTIGITRMKIAGSRAHERVSGEVVYYDDRDDAWSVFPPHDLTPRPYAYSFPSFDAAGGWIGTPIEYVRFINAVDGRSNTPDILNSQSISNMVAKPVPPHAPGSDGHSGMGWVIDIPTDSWWHSGAFPGSRSCMGRLSNGVSFCVAFNRYPSSSDSLHLVIWNAQAQVVTWPTNDLFAKPLSYDAWKKVKH